MATGLEDTLALGTFLVGRITSALNEMQSDDGTGASASAAFSAGLVHELANSLSLAKLFYSDAYASGHNEAGIRYAIVLLKLEHPDDAARIAIDLARTNPEGSTQSLTGAPTSVHTVIGDCLRVTGKIDAATRAYETALASVPGDTWAKNWLARLLIQSSKMDQARALDQTGLSDQVNSILRLSSNDPDFLPQLSTMTLNGASRIV